MKKIPFFAILFAFFVPFLAGYNSLNGPFSLTDDIAVLKTSQVLLKNFKEKNFLYFTNIEPEKGRIRPAYWLINLIPYATSGNNPVAFHLFHLLIICFSSVMAFLIVFTLTRNSASSLLTAFGLTFTVSSVENWSRLGTEEPFLIFFLLIAIYSIIKIYYKEHLTLYFTLAVSSLFLATFTKEIFPVILFPFFLLIIFSFLVIKKFNTFIQFLILIFLVQAVFAMLLFLDKFILGLSGGILNQFTVGKDFMLKNLDLYSKLIAKDTGYLLFLASAFFLIIVVKKSKDLRHETTMFKVFCLFFLAISTSFLAALSTQNLILGKSLPPVLAFLFIFIGCSSSYFFSITRRLKKATLGRIKVLGHLLSLIFIIYCLIFFYFQIKETLKEINSDKDRNLLESDMVKNVSLNLKENAKVYFIINESSFDYALGTGYHLNLFYGKNPQIERLNPNLLPPLNNGDLIVVSREFQEIPDPIIAQILSRKTLLYHTYLWTIYKIER